jgi:hypothetical protein
MATIVRIVKTSLWTAYIVAGKVTLAKDAKTGRFIKRNLVQMFIDTLAAQAVLSVRGYNNSFNAIAKKVLNVPSFFSDKLCVLLFTSNTLTDSEMRSVVRDCQNAGYYTDMIAA